MPTQMQEPQPGKQQHRKRFSWMLWSIVGIILIAILCIHGYCYPDTGEARCGARNKHIESHLYCCWHSN